MEKLYGWTGKILRIDLTSGEKEFLSTQNLAETFIGGRGFTAKIYWSEVSPSLDALSPESPLIIMTGPLAGTPALAGSRWFISGKSPLLYPDQYGLGSVGGGLGAELKAAGYDGIVISGRAPKPCYLSISDSTVVIKDAQGLWGLETYETLQKIRSAEGEKVQTACIGPAGENRVRVALAMSENGACGGSGFGAVMGSKNLKAIAVKGTGTVKTAHPEMLKQINKEIHSLIKGKILMDPSLEGIELIRRSPCRGCPGVCPRGLYKHRSGIEEIRKNCQSAYVYFSLDRKYHGGELTDASFLATTLCNRYGLCTQEMGNILRWLDKCVQKGIFTDEETGLPVSKMGSLEFIEALVQKMVSRQDFGDVLAEGTIRAARMAGKGSEKLLEGTVTRSGFNSNAYNPRYFITNAVFYATESTSTMNQLHEVCFPMIRWVIWYATDGASSPFSTEVMRKIAKRFWKNERAVDFSTYDGKAEVAFIIQNREYAKGNLVGCDFLYPLLTPDGTEDHVGDPTLESRILSAVTGMSIDEEAYYRTGERIFNLQRAIQGREGRVGRKDDKLDEFNFSEPLEIEEGFLGIFNPEFMLPGPGGELISRKGCVVERDKFEKMMDEYYVLRGWDVKTGLQKKEKLEALSLSEIIPEMERRNLLSPR
jgi:aldehyde:ferredoxin oxidoreductase